MPKVTSRPAAATIADVAEAAGVSRATVSRVMNGRASVREDISARVKAVAEELHYRPSNVARSLSLGRTETVALVVPDLTNPMFQHVLSGITDSAAAHGYRVLVADTAEKPADEAQIALEARLRCDALVMVSPRMPEDALASLVAQASPMVLVNRESPDPTVPSVTVNYRAGTSAVLTHLVELGHHRIAYLSGPPASYSDARRREGLADVLEAHTGLDLVCVPAGATVAAGYGALDAVLAARVTAVVAFNDLVAFGLLAALNQAGVAVPKDISVTGFDDIELAQYSTPSLTTAAVPQHELGRHAWQELHAVIENQSGRTSPHTRFEPRLEVRASSGPVPRTVAEGGLAPAPAVTAAREEGTADAAAPASAVVTEAPTAPPTWRRDGDAVVLEYAGERLARYEDGSRLPEVHAPRAYLHPVHTLAGTVLTDAAPVDHRHHYGVSLAVPDVNGTSHWGGRTYVRDVGPTLLKNHGRQASTGLLVGDADPHVLHDAVRWFDHHDAPQLEESRRLAAHVLPGADSWALAWRSVLRADHGPATIGSPATNGRAGAGYGGWFWRLPLTASALVLSAAGEGEEAAHGSRSPWLAFVQEHEGAATTWLAVQHGQPRPWFVRAAEYPGAGPALAWDAPLEIPAGGTIEIGLTTVLLDRALDAGEAAAVAAETADLR
ncbi:DUF6807 family protein [Demequina sp. NBRC 110057]|uniref:DUF6807 family protein n=1 Tax=Demequina sp. NBRC 110057 TaxID=1570346 RepID=UPI000A068D1A|nr:DUF6807 family protein [Demequina sp. NBRC 110057]